MAIIKLQGGLGNQMFQYAFGRFVSSRRNEPLILDITSFPDHNNREYCLDAFAVHAEVLNDPENIYKIKYQLQSRYWRVLCRLFNKPFPPPTGPSTKVLNEKVHADSVNPGFSLYLFRRLLAKF